jgi:uncharacterized protein involved in exopolysaccharide biosynthesis
MVVGWGLLMFALVAGLTLYFPRTYTSRSSFMPQARKASSSLSGIAAQFGLAMPTADGSQSPAFYGDLVQSRGILSSVVDTPFEYESDEGGKAKGTLTEFYKSKGKTPALRRDAAIRRLGDDISAATIQKTGVVNLDVTVPQPALALQINQRLLELLNDFNLRSRQSQAGEERRFTERRLGEVRQDLRAAEDRLQQFMQRNRDMRNSPELTFQADRLQREVMMQQQVYTTLAQAYEQAKIEEVRDTPVITIVQQPEMPVRPDRRGLIIKSLLGWVAGLVLGAALAFWKSYTGNTAGLATSEAAEFALLRRQAAGDLLRPWRPLAQMLGLARMRGP